MGYWIDLLNVIFKKKILEKCHHIKDYNIETSLPT
jgi:hypothetical protein